MNDKVMNTKFVVGYEKYMCSFSRATNDLLTYKLRDFVWVN